MVAAEKIFFEDKSITKRQKKVTHACIRCQVKKCKCIPTFQKIDGKTTCKNCFKKNVFCIFKKQNKRGPLTNTDFNARNKNTSVPNKTPISANTWIHKTNTLPMSLLNLPLDSDSDNEDQHRERDTQSNNANMIKGPWENEKSDEALLEYILYGYNDSKTTTLSKRPHNNKSFLIKEGFEIISKMRRTASQSLQPDITALEKILKQIND
ncbi:hypothetical protein QEN19_004192 [Hanseniaspora menglaensis]